MVGSYLKLQKTGANYRALCPFHSEKKPSFFVSPARQIWRCFGCGKGGDIFGFIKEIEGVEFGDALRILAQRAGIELKKQDVRLETERKRLYEISELAGKFFEKQLEASKAGQEARKYLLNRGVKEESIKKWRLGYAPNRWQGLSDFLVSQGYKRTEIEKAGLAIKSEKTGNYYDRFRGRIIFPVFDLSSQAVGFGGRVFEKEVEKPEPAPAGEEVPKEITEDILAKYINSPATILYDKSRILYGLDKAKLAIRKQDACILVEGYIDVISVSQAGYENIAAVSGTALTPYQLRILKRYSENLLIAFDMDTAGDSATKRGIDLAQAAGFNIKVIIMPQEMDPDDVVSEDPKQWERMVSEAKLILDFYFETTLAKFDAKTIDGKKQIAKILLPVVKAIPNKIEQNFWVQRLATELKIKEEAIEAELKKVKLEAVDVFEEELPQPTAKSRKQLLEERMIALAMYSPENLPTIKEEIPFFSPSCSQAIAYIEKSQGLEASDLPQEITDLINYLSLMAEAEEFASLDIKEELRRCLKGFKILAVKNKLDNFSKELKMAETENNSGKVEKLLQEFNLCSRTLHDLEAE